MPFAGVRPRPQRCAWLPGGSLPACRGGSGRSLAEATSAERRRLERDLHDGVQQRVLATGVRLRLLQARLPPGHAAEVDAAVAELRETINELRRIAHGIRPSQLDGGLAAALEAIRAASPIPIEVHAAGPNAAADGVRRGAGGCRTPEVVRALVRARGGSAREELSPRELDVLRLVAEGHSNAVIAEKLVLSGRTVESHVRSVFAKLALDDDGSTHRRVLAVVTYLESRLPP
ncbi:MAG: LuxR C-terminal-related transcriptional regulator [Tetrasphaera sp.]